MPKRIYLSKVPDVDAATVDRLADAIVAGGDSVTDVVILADGVIFVADRARPTIVDTITTMRAGTGTGCRIVLLLLADIDPNDRREFEAVADGVVSAGGLDDRIAQAIAIITDADPVVTDPDSRVLDVTLLHAERAIQLPSAVRALAHGRFGDRTVLVVSTEDGLLCTVDPATGEIVDTVQEHQTQTVSGVALVAGGIVAGDEDGVVRWWRQPRTDPVELAKHSGPVKAVTAAVEGGATVVTAGEARTLMVQDLESGLAAAFLSGHTDMVNGLAMGAVGDRPVVVSASADRTVRVWDLVTYQQILELTGHADSVTAVAFGVLDGLSIAASGSVDRTVRVWDLESGAEITVLRGHTGAIRAVAVTVIDGTTVVISGGDADVRIWDAVTGSQLGAPLEHGAPVRALAVGELDGVPALFTGDEDGEVRVWTPAPADRVEWLPDSPSTEDYLRRRPFATVLAQHLQRHHEQDPNTSLLMHIDGPWGAGKSTLLGYLGSELDQHGLATVEFDAWRESGVGPSWWALMRALRKTTIRERRPIERIWLRLAEATVRLRRAGTSAFLAFGLLLAVSIGAFFLFQPPSLTMTSVGDMARTATAVLAALGTLGTGARVVARLLLWDSAGGARLFERSDANPMQEVARHFHWLMRKTRRPVVFLIDDLDRCPQASVVELLNAVQTLVRSSTPAASFVVAADGAWIRASYEIEYEKFAPTIAETGRPLGYLFLDKLFQLHVPVPTIDAPGQRDYLGHLLGVRTERELAVEATNVRERMRRTTSESQIVEMLEDASVEVRARVAVDAMKRMNTPEITASTDRRLQRYGPLLPPNPRSMKLFVNTYTMLRTVRTLEGNPVPEQRLALWAVLETRWPSLADHLRQHPDHVELLGRSDGELAAVPERLRALFADPAVKRVTGFDPAQPLDADAIRSCCGATG